MSQSKSLIGIENIRKYYPRSESTIMSLIFHGDFPAKKINGRWESNKDLIDDWQKKQVAKTETGKKRRGRPKTK